MQSKYLTNKVIPSRSDIMKEQRKIVIKLLESEQMNTYKILAEFFAQKFNENGFDKVEQK